MIADVSLALWFLLPAALANVAPIVAARIPALKAWDAALDGGRLLGGKEIFGAHKTWRGLLSGMVVATITLFIQQSIAVDTLWFRDSLDYAALPVLLLGPAFAIGALGGDAIESFFKRRVGIASGKAWVPFDQVDYIIGAVFVSLFFVTLQPVVYLWMFVVWFLLHLVFSYVGYRLGLKQAPI